MPSMTPTEFVNKWRPTTLNEKAASQSHFHDLCRMVGHPAPTDADQSGDFYTFEKGVAVSGGGQGWADVWKRGHFAWEYKSPGKNLNDALLQVKKYRDDLENPPLLVVCDLKNFEIHTSFTNTVTQTYKFDLDALEANVPTPSCPLRPLLVLERVFQEPDRLRPSRTPADVTKDAAREFATLAASLQKRGNDPEQAAHFLMRLLFCLFSEDIGLLPDNLFTRLVEDTLYEPTEFRDQVSDLFGKMATGGRFGPFRVPHFNGGLFTDSDALDLTPADTEILRAACKLDWSSVEPAIFGTLFERSLDPAKRSQLGAQYTSREDIELIVEPVLMAPLRSRWAEVQTQARAIQAKYAAAPRPAGRQLAALSPEAREIHALLSGFQDEIAAIRVLDPACGSGNFLYVALKRLLDLEHEVSRFASRCGLPMLQSQVGPEQLYGIEIDAYAHELAQIVVWIGYIQWLKDNGLGAPAAPILKPLDTIQHCDAILSVAEDGTVSEPPWPDAEVIIGNPPFIGDKRMRTELGHRYVEALRQHYAGRVPGGADLVTYWFERARQHIEAGVARRAGLLATQAIRGGLNRRVLERIKRTGDIFMAWSDRQWVLDGAAVHVSVVGFDRGEETSRTLDGVIVSEINANLTEGTNLTLAHRLAENIGLSYRGDTKGGAFDIPPSLAEELLTAPLNPNGRSNVDVVKPWVNGGDVTGRSRQMWLIDFGPDMPEEEASLYELPFEFVLREVKPSRQGKNRSIYTEKWWIHMEPRPALRRAISNLSRFIATPMVSKHRVFVWLRHPTIPDQQLVMVAREDDFFFGMLHSHIHEVWTRAMASQLREAESATRYTPRATFETFPFPWPPGQEPTSDPRVVAISEAAKRLDQLRTNWLNPPGASADELKKRTLTNLYNQRPHWLDLAHKTLDAAVLDAYGWPHALPDAEILEKLLALNLSRPSA